MNDLVGRGVIEVTADASKLKAGADEPSTQCADLSPWPALYSVLHVLEQDGVSIDEVSINNS